MVLTGPPSTAIGLVAHALVQRRDLEGQLTPREREVLEVAAEGISARAIAERLGVRERTVTTHLARIYRKLGVRQPARRGSCGRPLRPGDDRRWGVALRFRTNR